MCFGAKAFAMQFDRGPRLRPKSIGVVEHCKILRAWIGVRKGLFPLLDMMNGWSRATPPGSEFCDYLDLATAYWFCIDLLRFSACELVDALQILHGDTDTCGPLWDTKQRSSHMQAKFASGAITKGLARSGTSMTP